MFSNISIYTSIRVGYLKSIELISSEKRKGSKIEIEAKGNDHLTSEIKYEILAVSSRAMIEAVDQGLYFTVSTSSHRDETKRDSLLSTIT